MTDTALIGSTCPLGAFWSSKRYFDYLIDETNLSLLRSKEFGQVVLICPSLWEGRRAIRENITAFAARVKALIDILHEMKVERMSYITCIDALPATGHEDSAPLRDSEEAWLASLLELKDYINLKFGRVLNISLPEVTGTGSDMSIVDMLASTSGSNKTLEAALLERHQLYPMSRIVHDVEKAWACGFSNVNLVPEPVTTFELVETCFPALVDRLPTAKESDPYGSARTSLRSSHYHDPDSGYIMDKTAVMESISNSLQG